MSKVVKRGYVLKDEKEFGGEAKRTLNQAAQEISFLINRGYDIKSASTFIGNHYLLSERQRLALVRMLSTKESVMKRKEKELMDIREQKLIHIDGFNLIITLEVALSDSLLLEGMDGTIRDLAGLRGTYRIIDKTEEAVRLILAELDANKIIKAIFYLDSPVSNSGRLKMLLLEMSADYSCSIEVQVIPGVDSLLKSKDSVVTSDAIILDSCNSWYNMTARILKNNLPEKSVFRLDWEQLSLI